jgi:hypothetical protein
MKEHATISDCEKTLPAHSLIVATLRLIKNFIAKLPLLSTLNFIVISFCRSETQPREQSHIKLSHTSNQTVSAQHTLGLLLWFLNLPKVQRAGAALSRAV